MVTFYFNNSFFHAPNIFIKGYICHYVEQMFRKNVLFSYEIWPEPPKFGKQKLKN